MKKHYPVMWFKGMPVGPEAFQQQNLYFESLISIYSQMIDSFGWGISSFEFDLSNLSEGFFKLKKLKGLNEDFFFFDVDESYNLQVNLKDFRTEFKNDKKLFVYLSCPNNDFTPQINENAPKYSTEYLEVNDLNNKSEKIGLSFLKTNYFLEIAEQNSLKNHSLPIAQIKFNGMSFSLTKYTPPTQKIENAPFLNNLLKELISKMKDKVKYLKNIKKLSLEQNSQLAGISSVLFVLEASLKSNDHPYNIYKTLVNAVAAAFVFAKKTDLPNIEKYDHKNITQSLLSLIDYINSNLDSIFESFKLYKFTKTPKHFEILLESATTEYILVAIEKDSSTNYQDLSSWISTCTIATIDKLESTKEQRSRGSERFKIENYKEYNIPEIPDMVVIKIILKNSFTTNNELLIIENENLNLPIPPSIHLIEV